MPIVTPKVNEESLMNTQPHTCPADALKSEELLPYAGEVTPKQVYDFLCEHEGILVDVRTQPEWQFVGMPDVSATKGEFAAISWKTYPNFETNEKFISTFDALDKNTALFFICRSGGRSMDAATAMTNRGFTHCFNVTGGFEGEPDERGHRGKKDGWKAASLPWIQR